MLNKITAPMANIFTRRNRRNQADAVDPNSQSPEREEPLFRTRTQIPGLLLSKEWDSKALSYSDLLPYAVKANKDTLLNKDGSLTATFRYRGEDLASQAPRSHAEVARHLNDGVSSLGRGWMLHFHSVRRETTGYLEGSHFPDATSAVIDSVRKTQFDNSDTHFTNETFVDLTYLAPPDLAMSGSNFFIDGREGSTSENAANEALKTFNEKLTGFVGHVSNDLRLERIGCRVIDTEHGPLEIDEQIQHLIECATGQDVPIRRTPAETDVSHLVANVPIENSLRLQIGEQLCAAVVVRDLPAQSYPGMFDYLNQLPYEYRVSWRYIVRDPEKAKIDIDIERKKWFNKRRGMAAAIQEKEVRHENQHAVEMAQDAANALSNLDRGEVAFGWFTMTIVFWQPITTKKTPMRTAGQAMADLMLQIDEVTGWVNRNHCQTYFERINVLEAFLGTLPAIGYAQIRRSMLSSRNLADFVPTHAVWQGKPYAPCPFYPPQSPPLAKVSTTGRTPFNLNLHVDDVGHFMIAGSSGGGKALDINEKLLTPTGWIRMGDVRVGSEIIGKNGTPTTVTNIFPQGVVPAYEVTLSDGTSVVTCAEHQWSVSKSSGTDKERTTYVTTTQDMVDVLQDQKHDLRIPMVEPVRYSTKKFPLDPYLLGTLLASGNLDCGVTLRCTDLEVVKRIQKVLPQDCLLKENAAFEYQFEAALSGYEQKVVNGTSVTFQNNNSVSIAISEIGLSGTKSEKKFIPDAYLRGSVEQRLALLQGLLDTSGSVKNRSVDFFTSSKRLAEQVIDLAQSLGGTGHITSRDTQSDQNKETRNAERDYNTSLQFRKDLQPFGLQRKINAFRDEDMLEPIRTVRSISPVKAREMQCISVAAADHLYVTTDHIVTHNSVVLGFLMVQHRRYRRSRQIVLDIGNSHYTLCNAVGGAHFDLGADSSIKFAPLAHIGEDDRELKWAITWVMELLEHRGVTTKHRATEIAKAVILLSRTEGPKSLTNLILQPYLSREERNALKYYTLEGDYKILDGDEDFTENSDFLCYEMGSMNDYPKDFKEPFLSYLFHRIERQCDGTPTMIVMEEVWAFLETEKAAQALIRWLRVMRKANVMVGFATQSIEDYAHSAVGPTMINNCQTKIFLPNPDATTKNQMPTYQLFGLTPWQIFMISKARSKRDYYVFSTEGKRMITLDLAPVELAFIGISNPILVKDAKRRIEAERKAIYEDPASLRNREPWQADWLRTRLREQDGDNWAKLWVSVWKEYGGWTTTVNKVKNVLVK